MNKVVNKIINDIENNNIQSWNNYIYNIEKYKSIKDIIYKLIDYIIDNKLYKRKDIENLLLEIDPYYTNIILLKITDSIKNFNIDFIYKLFDKHNNRQYQIIDKHIIKKMLYNLQDNEKLFNKFIEIMIKNNSIDNRSIILNFFIFNKFDKNPYIDLLDNIVDNHSFTYMSYSIINKKSQKDFYIDKLLLNDILEKKFNEIDQFILLNMYIATNDLIDTNIVKRIKKFNLSNYFDIIITYSNEEDNKNILNKLLNIEPNLLDYIKQYNKNDNIKIDLIYDLIRKSSIDTILKNSDKIINLTELDNNKIYNILKNKIKKDQLNSDIKRFNLLKFIKQLNSNIDIDIIDR